MMVNGFKNAFLYCWLIYAAMNDSICVEIYSTPLMETKQSVLPIKSHKPSESVSQKVFPRLKEYKDSALRGYKVGKEIQDRTVAPYGEIYTPKELLRLRSRFIFNQLHQKRIIRSIHKAYKNSSTRSLENSGTSQEETTTQNVGSNTGYSKKIETTFANRVFLCDHPQNRFSPDHLLNSDTDCEYEVTQEIRGETTYSLCDYIYEHIYGRSFEIERGMAFENGSYVDLIYDESFVDICLPLLRRFNRCEERKHLTICYDEEVLLFHSFECRPPSDMDSYFYPMLIETALDENDWCFERFCGGYLRLLEKRINNVIFHVNQLDLTILPQNETEECFDYMAIFIAKFRTMNNTKEFVNKYFPTCYPYAYVLWTGNTTRHILKEFWDLLPISCKTSETLMTILVGIVLMIGLIGNLLVIIVLFFSKHYKYESGMLRMSLAFADIMMSVFIVAPSFYDHILLISGYWYSDLEGNPLSNPDDISITTIINQSSSVQESETISDSHTQYRIFQGLALGTCIIASLLTLFVLSIERCIMTGKRLKYRDYVSPIRIKLAIAIIWIVAIADSLLLTIGEGGELSVTYKPSRRLPYGKNVYRSKTLKLIGDIRLGIIQILCLLTIFISIFSVRNFLKEKARVAKEWKDNNMIVIGPYEEENSRILTSLLVMSSLFACSLMPLYVYYRLLEYHHPYSNWPIIAYASWWMIMAPSAWNPLIYNTRSHYFKRDLKRMLTFLMRTE